MNTISLIVDGNNVACAAYFVSNVEDPNWNTGYVMNKFDSMIKRISREFNTNQIYIAWDCGGTKWRKEILPEYKADRSKEGKEKLYESIEECQELDYKHIRIQDTEGDDVIYALCKVIEGYKIVISADKDFVHLLQRGICDKLYNPISKQFREIPQIDDVTMRAICGHDDGLKGLKGKGPAFVKKYVEGKVALTEDEQILFDKHRLVMDLELNPYKDTCIEKVKELTNM